MDVKDPLHTALFCPLSEDDIFQYDIESLSQLLMQLLFA